jgi:hypothetical protein
MAVGMRGERTGRPTSLTRLRRRCSVGSISPHLHFASLVIRLTYFFSFFWWGVIRSISPRLVVASHCMALSSKPRVGRYSLGFAPGVGHYSVLVD